MAMAKLSSSSSSSFLPSAGFLKSLLFLSELPSTSFFYLPFSESFPFSLQILWKTRTRLDDRSAKEWTELFVSSLISRQDRDSHANPSRNPTLMLSATYGLRSPCSRSLEAIPTFCFCIITLKTKSMCMSSWIYAKVEIYVSS